MTDIKDLLVKDMLRKGLLLISALTVVSGLTQVVAPGFVLRLIGADVTLASSHFFGIVGMFMVLFGGLLLQALFAKAPQPIAVFWCGLQKFGAAAAVSMGVVREVFSWLALGVAGFDLLSGLLILIYWYLIRKTP
jgi:hypothetical protein